MGGILQSMFRGRQGERRRTPDTPECDLEIFLLGKTGNGKSATGNAILGRMQFKTADTAQSTTLSTDVGWTDRNGKTVKVVDGPGLLDTRLKSDEEQINQMNTNLSKGFLHCPNGFHALVLVLKYGNRYTDEEQKTVTVMRKMLGNSFIRDHCIIVFTYGDNYLLEHPYGNFKQWCKDQKGDIRELLNECKNRIVLFQNLKKETWEQSTSELISAAIAFPQRYTAEMFDKIADERLTFIEQHGAIQLKGQIQSKINMIIGCLKRDEKGPLLKKLVDELEAEVNKETSEKSFDSDTVKELKNGIQQTRDKQYAQARETFEVVELKGKSLLSKFLENVERIVMEYVIPAIHFVRKMYEQYKNFKNK